MKKVNLNNLYESHYPPTDINCLWVDRDENTGKIRAIHEYNKAKGEWEPSMVSVDYIQPGEGGGDEVNPEDVKITFFTVTQIYRIAQYGETFRVVNGTIVDDTAFDKYGLSSIADKFTLRDSDEHRLELFLNGIKLTEQSITGVTIHDHGLEEFGGKGVVSNINTTKLKKASAAYTSSQGLPEDSPESEVQFAAYKPVTLKQIQDIMNM